MNPPTAMHFIVRGRVQGVGFRVAVLREAERLALSGWVRNLTNGDVEAVARGDALPLARLAEWLRHGPQLARVDNLHAATIDEARCGKINQLRVNDDEVDRVDYVDRVDAIDDSDDSDVDGDDDDADDGDVANDIENQNAFVIRRDSAASLGG